MKILPRLFFKQKKASSFRYTPRYYSEEEKRKAARNKRLKRTAEQEKTAEGRAKLQLEKQKEINWAQERTQEANRGTQLRFGIILFVLAILTILFLKKLGIPIFGA